MLNNLLEIIKLITFTKRKNMSKKATLSLELAKIMYGGTDEQLKQFALENYPELGDVTSRVKTFEDACRELGIGVALPDVSKLPCEMRSKIIIGYKLSVIAKALNQGWQVDWSNDEYKYFPYFVYDKSERDLQFLSSVCGYYRSFVPAHLCFKSESLCTHATKFFYETYKAYMC